MLPVDRGTRDLLPPIEADQKEVIGPELTVTGSLVSASDIPLPTIPAAVHPAVDLPPAEQEDRATSAGSDEHSVTVPIKSMAPSIEGHHVSGALGEPHFVSISVAQNFSGPKPSATTYRDGAGSHDHRQDGHDRQDGYDRQDGHQVEPGGNDPRDGVNPASSDGDLAEIDNAHSIDVTQIAVVDQDASIMVSGYVGDVVARLHVDQDLVMDQDADVSFAIDGEGHFAVLLDQEMRIDQEIEIDLEIFDVDGVLHVDVFLRDSVEVEQDTTIDVRISDGPPGGTVEVNQDIELDQDIDVDIDIEDELEERYAIQAHVDVLQQADAHQDAIVDINDWNGEIDVDVDATQTAAIDQQTIVQVDFAVV